MSNFYSKTFSLIHKGNREEFKGLLSKGTPTPYYSLEDVGVPRRIHSFLRMALEEKYGLPNLIWKKIRGTYHTVNVVYITTPAGRIIAMRNGSNCGAYNFALLDTSLNYHWAMNVQEVMNWVEILGCRDEDVPLLLGKKYTHKQSLLVEKRLKQSFKSVA